MQGLENQLNRAARKGGLATHNQITYEFAAKIPWNPLRCPPSQLFGREAQTARPQLASTQELGPKP